MTTALDKKLLPKVISLLNNLGKQVTITRLTGEVFDPTTLETTNTGSEAQTVKITPPYPYEETYYNDTSIKAGDLKCYVSPDVVFDPELNYQMTVDGQLWTIVKMMPIYSGDNIVLFGAQLRS